MKANCSWCLKEIEVCDACEKDVAEGVTVLELTFCSRSCAIKYIVNDAYLAEVKNDKGRFPHH